MKRIIGIVLIIIVYILIRTMCERFSSSTKEDEKGFAKFADQLKVMITGKGALNNLSFDRDSRGIRTMDVIFSKDTKSNIWEKQKYSHAFGKWNLKKSVQFDSIMVINFITLSEFDLSKLPKIVEQSKNKVLELGVKDVVVKTFEIELNQERKTINNKLINDHILITLRPRHGGTDFKFSYDMNGSLTSFIYEKPIKIYVVHWYDKSKIMYK